MKAFFSILILVILSCKSKNELVISQNNTRFEFRLIDSLGTVSLKFPENTDTFFSWVQTGDCGKTCDRGDYRFQSRANRIFKETGSLWSGEPEDSVYQLSVYHQRADTVLKFSDSLIFHIKNNLLDRVLSGIRTGNILSDTLVKIGDRSFYVFQTAFFDEKNGIRDRRLIAFTTISGTILEFHYKLLTAKYDTITKHFFENSLENLYTVRLKDGG